MPGPRPNANAKRQRSCTRATADAACRHSSRRGRGRGLRDYYEGIPRLGTAAAATSYANVRASFSPIHHSKQIPGVLKGLNFGASREKACFDKRQLVKTRFFR